MRTSRLTLALAGLFLLAAATGPAHGARVGSRVVMPLVQTTSGDDVTGRMRFHSGNGSSRFTVEVHHAAERQTLNLVVGGVPRATITTNRRGSARFTFQSQGASNRGLPLDFDPRDQIVEVDDGNGMIVSNLTTDGSNPPGSVIDERAPLSATGAQPGAQGSIRFRERRGVQEFRVEVEHLADGSYDLLVDGSVRGLIAVAGGEGELDFSSASDDPDKLPLDFAPFGALIQVAQGSTIVLSGTGLAPAPGANVCVPSEATTLLSNAGAIPGASGEARLRLRDDCRRQFRVEVENLPAGSYDVVVGDVVRGAINVALQAGGETEGELEFSSEPDESGDLPLDFDPAGATIEVEQGGIVYLSSTTADAMPGVCDPADVELPMTNAGASPDAKGKARFRQDVDCGQDFRVETEKLPLGTYELVVGGIIRGTIVVELVAGEAVGQIEFDRNPDQPGELLLDFDPRGQVVEVQQGAMIFLNVTLPN